MASAFQAGLASPFYRYLQNEVEIFVQSGVDRRAFKKSPETLRVIRVEMRIRIRLVDDSAAQVTKIRLKYSQIEIEGRKFNPASAADHFVAAVRFDDCLIAFRTRNRIFADKRHALKNFIKKIISKKNKYLN